MKIIVDSEMVRIEGHGFHLRMHGAPNFEAFDIRVHTSKPIDFNAMFLIGSLAMVRYELLLSWKLLQEELAQTKSKEHGESIMKRIRAFPDEHDVKTQRNFTLGGTVLPQFYHLLPHIFSFGSPLRKSSTDIDFIIDLAMAFAKSKMQDVALHLINSILSLEPENFPALCAEFDIKQDVKLFVKLIEIGETTGQDITRFKTMLPIENPQTHEDLVHNTCLELEREYPNSDIIYDCGKKEIFVISVGSTKSDQKKPGSSLSVTFIENAEFLSKRPQSPELSGGNRILVKQRPLTGGELVHTAGTLGCIYPDLKGAMRCILSAGHVLNCFHLRPFDSRLGVN